jgi:hypothetical protein
VELLVKEMFSATDADDSQDPTMKNDRSEERGTPALKNMKDLEEKANYQHPLTANNQSPNRMKKFPNKYIKESPSMREIHCEKQNTFKQGS